MAQTSEKAAAKAAKETEKAAAKASFASVLNAHGAHVRTYTLEVHGEAFADLANEFVAHTPGTSVVLS